MSQIQEFKEKILGGEMLSAEEALSFENTADADLPELFSCAEEITRRCVSREFDTCSIINARSGRCSENCKWCAQSAHYNTNCDVYPLVSRQECLDAAEYNRRRGVRRFSLVTSGRALRGADLDRACGYISEIHSRGGIGLCASMGLLGREELQKLRDAGVSRYHCNLEAAPSYFGTLCSTHTVEDKIRTISIARELGMEVCSGGIIGMGETRRQRIELALELRRVEPESIPLNVLSPIPGTPLEHAEPISEQEILATVAFFRFVHPSVAIRFAGGRARLSAESQLQALRIGVNGAIVGDLLTTIGSKIADDRTLATMAGYTV